MFPGKSPRHPPPSVSLDEMFCTPDVPPDQNQILTNHVTSMKQMGNTAAMDNIKLKCTVVALKAL
jgi:hypothetical protein